MTGIKVQSKTDWKAMRGPIGLFGGTFDPVQNAHLAIADAAIGSGLVQSVVFIPAGMNPLKTARPSATGLQRVEMIKLCIGQKKNVHVSDLELIRATTMPSYTFDTVQEIKQRTSTSQKLFFIMGSDCLVHLSKWHRVEELIDLLDGFIVYPRPGYQIENLQLLEQGLSPEHAAKVVKHPMQGVQYEVAANEIRDRIAAEKEISNFTPQTVVEYIYAHKLYRHI